MLSPGDGLMKTDCHLRIFESGPLWTDCQFAEPQGGLMKTDRPLKDLCGWSGIEKPFVY